MRSLLPGERARLHAGFAVALEARRGAREEGRPVSGPPPTAAELAYHWEEAGDDRRALAASVDAGVEAERGYAYLDAHGHYLRALELWTDGAGRDGRARSGRRLRACCGDRGPVGRVRRRRGSRRAGHRVGRRRRSTRAGPPPSRSASAGISGRQATVPPRPLPSRSPNDWSRPTRHPRRERGSSPTVPAS